MVSKNDNQSKSVSTASSKLSKAIVLHERGQLALAQALCEQIVAIDPDNSEALHLLGLMAYQTSKPQRAVELLTRAINVNPTNPIFYSNCGNALYVLNQLDSAIESYDRAIALNPNFVDAYFNRGSALQALMQFEQAIESYTCAIKIKPKFAEGYCNRGNVFQILKQWKEALNDYDRAIAIKAEFIEALVNRGLVFQELNQLEAAVKSYDRAIALNPNFSDAFFNRANTLRELNQFEAAIENYDRAISIDPNYSDAYFNRGNTFLELKQFDKAIESYDRVIVINPDFADAYFSRGNALFALKRFETAIDNYNCGLAIKPDFAEIFVNRGNALQNLMQFEASVASYNSAIAIQPDYAEAYIGRGSVQQEMYQMDNAVISYSKAIAINPNLDYLFGALVHAKMHLCDWTNFKNEAEELENRIECGEKVSPAFPMVAVTNSLSIQRKVSEVWINDKYPPNNTLGNIPHRRRSEKIRMGYFSADFHAHPILLLLAELFELHDKSRFELIAFSLGPDTQDVMRRRVQQTFDHFIDVRSRSDKEVAELARELNIDIAIDLGGATKNTRPGIFAYRAAPIQVNYLGWPGTMGAEYFDYLIADKTIIPESAQNYYAEKIAYLPNSYQANDSKRNISERVFTRLELKLPETGFVFCCFNNNYKITPVVFDSWMRVLAAVEDSVLFLYAGNPVAEQNLRKEANIRGIDPKRLVFAEGIPVGDYLARYKIADLFLNTFPYNAGTTASDALWAGLPVLTLSGETFVSRVTASLLQAIDLSELITESQKSYEALAIELATQPDKLNEIKTKLATNRLTMPLFDTKLFTRHIEDAYTQMVDRYYAGLEPDHIYVKP